MVEHQTLLSGIPFQGVTVWQRKPQTDSRAAAGTLSGSQDSRMKRSSRALALTDRGHSKGFSCV